MRVIRKSSLLAFIIAMSLTLPLSAAADQGGRGTGGGDGGGGGRGGGGGGGGGGKARQAEKVSGREVPVRVSYVQTGSETPSSAPFARLAGDGNGNIVDSPAFLLPWIEVKAYGERDRFAGAGMPLFAVCSEMGPQGVRGGRRWISLVDNSGKTLAVSEDYIEARSSGKHGRKAVTLIPAEGCVVRCEFEDKRTGTFHTQLDPGGYDGAETAFMYGTFSYQPSPSRFMGNSTWHGLATFGQFRITWIKAEGGMSVRVRDETRGIDIPFSRWLDDPCWGFVPPGVDAMQINKDLGVEWGGPDNVKTPRTERELALVKSLPADNTRDFHLYVNGQHWWFSREGGISMPAPGTEMVLITAFGEWNAGRTEFTQFPGPAYLGEKWKIELAGESARAVAAGEPRGLIEGIMLESGTPMSCVTVHLSGGRADEIRATKHDGLYSFEGLEDGTYSIVPFKTGFSFQPAYREITLDGGKVTVEPFNASPLLDTDNMGDTLSVAGILMTRAPAGRFRIGQNGIATPLHHIELDAFLIGTREITRGQYRDVMGTDPSSAGDSDDHPVEGVSWYDAATFCNRLSERAGLEPCYDEQDWSCDFTADGFRLPTEAEWEYACRAGSYTNFFPGCDESDLARVGWYGMDEQTGGTRPVAGKNPNSWGLSDTHGNVAEWCYDWYARYPSEDQSNPTGPRLGSVRVVRGGSWSSEPFPCRSAFRDGLEPDKENNKTGFRVVKRQN